VYKRQRFRRRGTITLDGGGNVFGGPLSLNTDANGASARAAATVVSSGALELGETFAGALSVEVGGAATQSAGTSVDVASAEIAAQGDVTLAEADNDFGIRLDLSGDALSMRDVDALALGDVAGDSLTARAGGAVDDIAGAKIELTGDALIETGGAALTLTRSGGHDIDGTLTLDVGAAEISTSEALILAGVAASLDVTSGDFDVSAPLTIGGGAGPLTARAFAGDASLGAGAPGYDVEAASLLNISARTCLLYTSPTPRD